MRSLRRHVVTGIMNRIPLCCIARYCLDPERFPSGLLRGGARNRHGVFVPCGLFHRAETPPDASEISAYFECNPVGWR